MKGSSSNAKRFAVWVNGRLCYPGQWLMLNRDTVRSFDTIEEAAAFLTALGYIDSTDASRTGTAFVARNPQFWNEGVDRAEQALGVQ